MSWWSEHFNPDVRVSVTTPQITTSMKNMIIGQRWEKQTTQFFPTKGDRKERQDTQLIKVLQQPLENDIIIIALPLG